MHFDPEVEGRRRQAIHAGRPHSTERFFADPDEENIISLYGEKQFAEEFECEVDLTLRPGGDGGCDFYIKAVGTINVHTARKPFNLLVKEIDVKKNVNIYVLARFNEDKTVELLGWEYGIRMAQRPKGDVGRKGIISHFKPREDLMPLSSLRYLCGYKPWLERLGIYASRHQQGSPTNLSVVAQ